MHDRLVEEYRESTSKGLIGGKSKNIKHPTFEYPLIHFSHQGEEE
jgi:hypothetical protein